MRAIMCLAALVIIVSFISMSSRVSPVAAKKTATTPLQRESTPSADAPLPPDLIGSVQGPMRSAAAADTFVLHSATFDGPTGPDRMGYTSHDRTEQEAIFFHVADVTELDGGQFGNLLPLNGAKSMWCGQYASTTVPYCGYTSLPGYGNRWDQILESTLLPGDSVSLTYKVFWDSEPGYDRTVVEYLWDDGIEHGWYWFPITDSLSTSPHVYDGTSLTPHMTETVTNRYAIPPGSEIKVRFRFTSDGAWSDEDGLWQTDGAIIVDDITINTWASGAPAASDNEDFESAPAGSHTAGIWTGHGAPTFGDYADLYPGVTVWQEDPCFNNMSFFWGFFDDPLVTSYDCHRPNPLPGQGAMPYGTVDWVYMWDQIWSPPFDNIGSGDDYRLSFLVYRDLALDRMQFYRWHVRSWKDPDGAGPQPSCPGVWRDFNFVYYGGQQDWHRSSFQIGSLVDPEADQLQIAVGAWDGCAVWYCWNEECHSHAPLIDEIRVERISVTGPQYTVRQFELFQDNFAEDGTLTGTARADAAIDILPSGSPGIQPGDSVVITIAPVGTDPNTGTGPAAYAYVAVQPFGQTGKTPTDMEAPETREGGKRWPLVGTTTIENIEWAFFRMDSVIAGGGAAPDKYCFDLNDDLFTPGDTILYFFAADADGTPDTGNERYWHRTMQGQGTATTTSDIHEAAASPCEMTILPAGGYNRGGDILYVDDTDDRGGPVQLFFDSAFDHLGIRREIDRFDVLGPSSAVGNSLASRVKNNITQIIDIYKTIIWSSGNLSSATVGDGTGNPEKSDDFGLLYQFLNTSDKNPGLYLTGDDIAKEWEYRSGAGAIQLRSVYLNHNVPDGSHINRGEVVSPTLTANGAPFDHMGAPHRLIAHGGCPLVNDFDVLQPTGTAVVEFPYPTIGDGAVISQTTTNAAAATATVLLSGFSFDYIRDAPEVWPTWPPARVKHLRAVLIKLGNVVPEASGMPWVPQPQYANFLKPSYPNPFNPTTTIVYGIKKEAHVSLKVYNAAGQLVRTLVNEVQTPDEIGPVRWDGTNDAGQTVSSGVYFYKLIAKDFSQTRKTVLLK